MKKLNQASKIILFIFIFLFQVSNFAYAEVTLWKYSENIIAGGVFGVHDSFPSLTACENHRTAYKATPKGITAQPTACTSYTVAGLPVPAADPIDPPVDVNATTKPVDLGDDTYTFLAPIGSETSVKTSNIGEYINTIIKTIIGISAALAVIMIILAGIQMMGDESVFSKVEAKSKISGAILGLVIALGSYALLNTINPDLLGKNGLSISGVDIEVEDQPLTSNDTFRPGTPTSGCAEGIVYAQTAAGQIPVCKTQETKITEMIAKAKASGINLSGYGYRSTDRQRELRAQNCGGKVNIDNPNAKCKPLTAMPGRSMHENGLAVDFQCDGVQITSKRNECFVWLKKNGKEYGYLNELASEPWHWSVNGH